MEGKWFPIELKYKTLKMNTEIGGEYFNLKNHGAQDLGRYDFWVDVFRIEQLKQSIDNYEKGFVIIYPMNRPTGSILKVIKKLSAILLEFMTAVITGGLYLG